MKHLFNLAIFLLVARHALHIASDWQTNRAYFFIHLGTDALILGAMFIGMNWSHIRDWLNARMLRRALLESRSAHK